MTHLSPKRRILHSSGKANGFTLLETLVALTILSLSVATLFGIFSQTLGRTRDDNRAMQARVLAQSLLTAAESSPPKSSQRGEDGSGLEWLLHVAPYGEADRSSGLHAESITATIRWNSGAGERSLALTTLVVAPPEATP